MESKKTSNELYRANRLWVKASDYTLYEENGSYSIVPKENATIEKYDPFEEAKELINDFIQMANEIFSHHYADMISLKSHIKSLNRHPSRSNVKQLESLKRKLANTYTTIGNRILVFVGKYGLFGLFQSFAHDIIYVQTDDFGTREYGVIPTAEYLRKKNITPRNIGDMLIAHDSYIKDFFPTTKKPQNYYEDYEMFFKSYGENVDDLIHAINYIRKKIQVIASTLDPSEFNENKIKINEVTLYNQMDKNGDIHIIYGFNSLYDAIQLMHIKDKVRNTKICANPECKIPFVKRHKDQIYCTPECSEKYRQHKFRNRKHEEAKKIILKKKDEGFTFEEVLAYVEKNCDYITKKKVKEFYYDTKNLEIKIKNMLEESKTVAEVHSLYGHIFDIEKIRRLNRDVLKMR